jgi:hypothetical protein
LRIEKAPSFSEIQDFDVDLADTERLFAVSRRIGILARQMDDTVFLAGSEAYEHALWLSTKAPKG